MNDLESISNSRLASTVTFHKSAIECEFSN